MAKVFVVLILFAGSFANARTHRHHQLRYGATMGSVAYVEKTIGWSPNLSLGNGQDNARNLVRLAHWIEARPEECSPSRPPAHGLAVASWKTAGNKYGVSAVSQGGMWKTDMGEFRPSMRNYGFYCAIRPTSK